MSIGPTENHAFHCHDPYEDVLGWWFVVEGQRVARYGPYASRQAAEAGQHHHFQRWAERARLRGGWAWRHTHQIWVMALPKGVPCPGVAFEPAVITCHSR